MAGRFPASDWTEPEVSRNDSQGGGGSIDWWNATDDDDDGIEGSGAIPLLADAPPTGHSSPFSPSRQRIRHRWQLTLASLVGLFQPNDAASPTPPRSPSLIGPVSNLCSATLGAGALSLPYAIRLAGLIPGLSLLALSSYATVYSVDVIVDSCVVAGFATYEDATRRLVGRRARTILEGSLLIFCFGTAVAYVVAVGDILDQAVRAATNGELPAYYSRERVMVMFWTLVMFPLSLQRRTDGLKWVSSLGVASIAFLVFSAAVHFLRQGGSSAPNFDDGDGSTMDAPGLLWPASFWDVIRACPIVMFAFSCQVNVCAIFDELRPPPELSAPPSSNDDDVVDREHHFPPTFEQHRLLREEDRSETGREEPRELELRHRVDASHSSAGNGSGTVVAEEASRLFPPIERPPPAEWTQRRERRRKQRLMNRVTRRGVAVCTFLYVIMGTVGYLDFRGRTTDNVLKNYCLQTTHDVMMIAATMLVGVAVVVAFPLNILPARVTIEGICRRRRARWEEERKHAHPQTERGNWTCRYGTGEVNQEGPNGGGGVLLSMMKRRSAATATPLENEDVAFISPPTARYDGNDVVLLEGGESVQPILLPEEAGSSSQLRAPPSPMSLSERHDMGVDAGTGGDDSARHGGTGESNIDRDLHQGGGGASPPMQSTPMQHFLLTLLLSGGALYVALLVPDISVLFGLMGGTASSVISFILPGMFLLRTTAPSASLSEGTPWMQRHGDATVEEDEGSRSVAASRDGEHRIDGERGKIYGAWLLIGSGTAIGILSTGVTLHSLFFPADGDADAEELCPA